MTVLLLRLVAIFSLIFEAADAWGLFDHEFNRLRTLSAKVYLHCNRSYEARIMLFDVNGDDQALVNQTRLKGDKTTGTQNAVIVGSWSRSGFDEPVFFHLFVVHDCGKETALPKLGFKTKHIYMEQHDDEREVHWYFDLTYHEKDTVIKDQYHNVE